MSASTILSVWLLLFGIYVLVDAGLLLLNLRHVCRSRTLPAELAGYFSDETFHRAREYTIARGQLTLAATFLSAATVLVFVLGGLFGALDLALEQFGLGRYVTGISYVFVLSLLFTIIQLPFSLYSTFGIEARFGFNRMTPRMWLLDALKGLVLSVVLLAPLLAGIFWFVDAAGDLWWLYAFLLVSAFQLTMAFVFPIWIAPLFNRFSPLEDAALQEEVLNLCQRLHFGVAGVFQMDGSRRTAHANAWFSGFGGSRRIVLFDTLLETLSREQTLAVLAHEIGHARRHHIRKSLGVSVVCTLIGFGLLGLLIGEPAFYEAFGFMQPSTHAALVIFMFASSPVTFFLAPLSSMLSRRFEYEADRFASDAVGGPQPLIEALVALSRRSLSNLTPHPWYSFFHYAHPTLAERIRAMSREGMQPASGVPGA